MNLKPVEDVADSNSLIKPGFDAPEEGAATTERNLHTIACFEESERFRLGFEAANIGIGLIDLEGNIFEANKCLADTLGMPGRELKGTNLMEICAPEERLLALADLQLAARTGKFEAVFERHFLSEREGLLLAQVTRGLVRNVDGQPMYFIFTVRDITREKLKEALLEQQASTDPLTGVVNRARIQERSEFELMRSDRYGNPVSLVMIDLDRFKAVNDTYGHSAGDRVLSGFCDIARGCLRSVDILGRWGGEEFVALLPQTTLVEARNVAERLRTKVEATEFDGGICITASIGAALHREDEQFASLIERADACLYSAKRDGRNQVVIDGEDAAREIAREGCLSPMLALHWKPAYESGNSVIDTEHRALFQMANTIIAEITSGQEDSEILDSIHTLVARIGEHFRDEENILRSAGYPDAKSHGQMHRQLFEEAGRLTRQFERGEKSEGGLLRFLVHDVIAKHMLQADRNFISWFQAKHD